MLNLVTYLIYSTKQHNSRWIIKTWFYKFFSCMGMVVIIPNEIQNGVRDFFILAAKSPYSGLRSIFTLLCVGWLNKICQHIWNVDFGLVTWLVWFGRFWISFQSFVQKFVKLSFEDHLCEKNLFSIYDIAIEFKTSNLV